MLILIYGLLLYCITGLDLRQVEDVQALCLDGSLGSYYYSKGSGKGKNKFIIHFEGGDWILGNTEDEFLQNAAKRQQSMYGSSINRVTTQTFNGLLSENAEVNPNFYNWNLIHINYCDGTGFQGMKLAPIVYKSKNIYFRGELIVKSVFSKFKELFQEADTILLSGCSVGAIASLLWTDYLQIIIPTDVQIYCIPDSGILVDMSSIDGKQLLQTSLKIINYLVDIESTIPHEKCALNFPNQAWKCFYISNLLQYVTAPIFIIQSLYDSRFLQTYLQINCVSDLTLSSCTNDELIHINLAHDNFYNTINSIISKQPGTGSFAPSCLSNCLFLSSAVQSDKWAIPEKSGQTIQDTLMLWIDHQQKNTTCDKIALIDQVFWPDNSPCAYQLSKGLNNLIYFMCVLLVL